MTPTNAPLIYTNIVFYHSSLFGITPSSGTMYDYLCISKVCRCWCHEWTI